MSVAVAGVASFAVVGLVGGTVSLVSSSTSNGDNMANAQVIEAAATEVDGGVRELPLGDVEPIRSGADITLPIDEFRTSDAAQERVLRAEHRVLVACMARFGLAWDLPVAPASGMDRSNDRLFGVIDLDDVTEFGYHVPDNGVHQQDGSVVDTVKRAASVSLSAEQEAVASGESGPTEINGVTIPEGGCLGEARARLGNDGGALEMTESAVDFGVSQSERDPRVREGFAQWSACMAESGFTYATPWDANDDPRWATPEATDAEREAAVADVACKKSTGVTELQVAVAAAWQREYIDSHRAEFAAMKQSLARQQARADAILAEDG
ncbi:hypothetical protein [Microbacterium sp.]|uniref:hypothetical protein n=1 Tax=Microbacterium sp. TaxID=51671 RepID=UPI003A8B444E